MVTLYSTNGNTAEASLEEAVLKGLAGDNGLFMPKEIPLLPWSFYTGISTLPFAEISYRVASAILGDSVPKQVLKKIVEETITFEAPLIQLDEKVFSLELFHGPTLAFKDFGARFMARLLGYYTRHADRTINVLVATSGDTGSAVASGFLGVPGTRVIILYPGGKVSKIQEQQLTTMGGNVAALEVNGNFDDCQRLVKEAFADEDINERLVLTSANSINIARLIPQSFYYFQAYAQLKDKSKLLVFSVPSGNFGNLTGGLIAEKMGLPVSRFIASTNINDVVPKFLLTGDYRPGPGKPTISNAMDVGNPSNFARLFRLYQQDVDQVREHISGYAFTDEETREAMKEIYRRYDYVADPHGAVGYLGLREYQKKSPRPANGIFLETAHPAKFLDVVEPVLGIKVEVPARLQQCMDKKKDSLRIAADFKALKDFLCEME